MVKQKVKIIPTVNYSCLNDVSLVRFTVVHKVFFFFDLSKNPLNCRPSVFFLSSHSRTTQFVFFFAIVYNQPNLFIANVGKHSRWLLYGNGDSFHLKFNNVELFVILPHKISRVRHCHFHLLFFFSFLPLSHSLRLFCVGLYFVFFIQQYLFQ